MSILSKILQVKEGEVRELKAETTLERLKSESARFSAVPFVDALRSHSFPSIIAEVKRASPSRGIIRGDLDPITTALAFERAGAAAISVLTDEQFFQGSLEFLSGIRQSQSSGRIPLLRKEFIIDALQVWQSKAAGADAVLLIAAALSDDLLGNLLLECEAAGLDVLLEVHTESELIRANDVIFSLKTAPRIALGINNRDLASFDITLETTTRLIPIIKKLFPESFLQRSAIVSESGIFTVEDLGYLQSQGSHAYLLGESLVKFGEPGANLQELIKSASQ